MAVFVYGPHVERCLVAKGRPGNIVGHRNGAICVQTGEGLIWVSHLKKKRQGDTKFFKLPATHVLDMEAVPELPEPQLEYPLDTIRPPTFQEIWITTDGPVCHVHFRFYNGAMSTKQCNKLTSVLEHVGNLPGIKVVVLLGGFHHFSNGIHLNVIEASADPAKESLDNIVAMNGVVRALFSMHDRVTIAALQGNAGAGGVMFAAAADIVWAYSDVVLNPHYKSMGLFGSEFWTHFLPRRVGHQRALQLTEEMKPITAKMAMQIGLVDRVMARGSRDLFPSIAMAEARKIADDILYCDSKWADMLARKHEERACGDTNFMVAALEAENHELDIMRKNFVSKEYNEARFRFVWKTCATPAICGKSS